MRPSLSLAVLFRSPARTALTAVLLCAVSFALFAQVGGYAVTAREFDKAALQYRGVGAAEAEPPGEQAIKTPFYIYSDPRISGSFTDAEKEFRYDSFTTPGEFDSFDLDEVRYRPLTANQISAVTRLPHVALADTRYMTAGFSDIYTRLYEGTPYWPYTGRIIVEATLSELQLLPPQAASAADPFFQVNTLWLDDSRVLAGNWLYPDNPDRIKVFSENNDQSPFFQTRGTDGNAIFSWYRPYYAYGANFMRTLEPDRRYVFVLQDHPILANSYVDRPGTTISPTLYLNDIITDPWCPAVWLVDGEPENYLSLEKFTPLRELIEITNADIHTFDMVYTEDMGAILRFSGGDMSILAGRALTKSDSDNRAALCVVSRELARAYSLGVGDTLTFRLGTELFEQYKGLGAVAATRERYCPPVETVALEIAGIYMDTDNGIIQSKKPHWSYSINTVFLPKSLLPVDESAIAGHVFTPAEFSFMLDSAWHTTAFLDAAGPLFDELGLRLLFDDRGWPLIEEGYLRAGRLSLFNIAMFSAAVCIAIVFSVYLFIGRQRREYAIMRALGMPKGESARALVLPLLCVTAISALVGSGAAWIYTAGTLGRSDALLLLKDYNLDTAVPVWVAIVCVPGELMLTLLCALGMLRRIGKAPPLALMQGHTRLFARDHRRKGTGHRIGDGFPPDRGQKGSGADK